MKREKKQPTKGAASGIVALIFLILGFQLAVFFMKVVQRPAPAVVESIHAVEPPDDAVADTTMPRKIGKTVRMSAGISTFKKEKRLYESFTFDPNTISSDSLIRLGFSRKQAESIVNYRSKGGKFRATDDFARMYVVSDTLFTRLRPFIRIPRTDLNSADSTALVELKGIGPYYAHRILEYRSALGGFFNIEQLLEIKGMDSDKINGFRESVCIDSSRVSKFNLWEASDSLLASHPYIGKPAARRISRFKSVYDSAQWSNSALLRDHVIDSSALVRLIPYLAL